MYESDTYTNSTSLLISIGRGNVLAHGNIFASRGYLTGLGTNPQNGIALSNVTPFTKWGLHVAKYKATNPPNELPTTWTSSPITYKNQFCHYINHIHLMESILQER